MKKGVKIIMQTLEIKLAKQKVDLLRKMKKETMDGEGPYAHVATEFRRRLLHSETITHSLQTYGTLKLKLKLKDFDLSHLEIEISRPS